MPNNKQQKYLSALETLYRTTLDPTVDFEAKVDQLLNLGLQIFGLKLAILSQVESADYYVRHIIGPDGAPRPGAKFDLSETYCVHTLAAKAPVSFHHVANSEIKNHPCYKNFQLESYIGAPVFVGEKRYGTLNFSSPDIHPHPFSDEDHSLINLCAQWIGGELLRHQNNQHLREQKTLFESMFRSVPDAILVSDANRTIKLVNPAFTRLFGYAPEEVLGKSTSMLFANEEDWFAAKSRLYDATQTDEIAPFPVRYQKKNGDEFWIEVIGAPLLDTGNNVLGFLAIGRDITDRLQAEAAKSEFISVISHELRTATDFN